MTTGCLETPDKHDAWVDHNDQIMKQVVQIPVQSCYKQNKMLKWPKSDTLANSQTQSKSATDVNSIETVIAINIWGHTNKES